MSWEIVEIGSFLTERKGHFKPNDKEISDLKRIDKINFSGKIFLSEKSSKTNMILIKNGDLVISGINVAKGAMAIYKGEEDVKATIHYSSYIYNKNKIDIEFLNHFLKSQTFIDAIKEQIPGGIKTEIKPKHILPLKVFIPTSIKEQRKIVELLDNRNSNVKDISTQLTHQLDLVKQLRQAFLREAMQGKLIDNGELKIENEETGAELLAKIKAEKEKLIKEKKIKKQKPLPPIAKDEIPFEIPDSWVWCRLGEIVKEQDYGTSSKASLSDEIPVLRMGNISTNGEIFYSNLKYVPKTIKDLPRLYLKNGDLVFNRTNSYELVGKCGVFYNSDIYTLASYLIRIRFTSNTSSRFVSNYINSSLCRETQIEPQIIQQNGQANFNGTKLSNIIVPLPPLQEQKVIVKKLDKLMAYCDSLEESIKKSQTENEMLLQQVLREALEPKTESIKEEVIL